MDASSRTGGREYQNIDDVVKVAKVFALTALDVCNRTAEKA
jgi:hypothetical protein